MVVIGEVVGWWGGGVGGGGWWGGGGGGGGVLAALIVDQTGESQFLQSGITCLRVEAIIMHCKYQPRSSTSSNYVLIMLWPFWLISPPPLPRVLSVQMTVMKTLLSSTP